MVSKVKGGESNHAKILGLKVVKFILDEVIEGHLKEEDFKQFKLKNTNNVKMVEDRSTSKKMTIMWKRFPNRERVQVSYDKGT